MSDVELDAMAKIAAVLDPIKDKDALARVLQWAHARFGAGAVVPAAPRGLAPKDGSSERPPSLRGKELPGIARLSPSGALQITARDLKARSGLDAVERLTHIAIWANEQLTGESSLSSRQGLVPILKSYRIYDANGRRRIRQLRGVIRDGDLMSLDSHAATVAEKYAKDVLDPSVEGKWAPAARRPTRNGNKKP